MTIFLTVLHVMVCFVLVIVVLLQHGKGADVGAVFGGGASNTVFGSRGAGNFLSRLTTGAALLFMVSSLSLSYLANTNLTGSLFEEEAPPPSAAAPAPGAGAGETAAPSEGAAPGGFEEVAPPAAVAPSPEPTARAADAGTPAKPEAAATSQAPAAEPSAPAPASPPPANP